MSHWKIAVCNQGIVMHFDTTLSYTSGHKGAICYWKRSDDICFLSNAVTLCRNLSSRRPSLCAWGLLQSLKSRSLTSSRSTGHSSTRQKPSSDPHSQADEHPGPHMNPWKEISTGWQRRACLAKHHLLGRTCWKDLVLPAWCPPPHEMDGLYHLCPEDDVAAWSALEKSHPSSDFPSLPWRCTSRGGLRWQWASFFPAPATTATPLCCTLPGHNTCWLILIFLGSFTKPSVKVTVHTNGIIN